ncbi:hypothetical protein GCM10023200_52030 [Actinomycetospora chlora]|uniref:Uncharacterized protein n=1 Tax=Actinomycetospora chlora TaxID=663608 RepID=A0ABP9CCV6_9PSEU
MVLSYKEALKGAPTSNTEFPIRNQPSSDSFAPGRSRRSPVWRRITLKACIADLLTHECEGHHNFLVMANPIEKKYHGNQKGEARNNECTSKSVAAPRRR